MKLKAALRFALTAAFLCAAFLSLESCGTTAAHMVDEKGEPQPYLDPLWRVVDSAFPGALPETVTVKLIDKPHSGFDISRDTILISRSFDPRVSRGKVCLGLAHLALNRLSGGSGLVKGRCFDNDVRFLEYALASYLDRSAAGSMESELKESVAAAARMFRKGELSAKKLRDWESFCYRGRWADQFEEWNLEGLQALLSLGDFLVKEKAWSLKDLGRVFSRLEEKGMTLDTAFALELGSDLGKTLGEWKEYVLKRAEESGLTKEKEKK